MSLPALEGRARPVVVVVLAVVAAAGDDVDDDEEAARSELSWDVKVREAGRFNSFFCFLGAGCP